MDPRMFKKNVTSNAQASPKPPRPINPGGFSSCSTGEIWLNQSMIAKCYCQHCNGGIEFEAEELTEQNSVVPCPHCGIETRLFVSAQETLPIPAPQSFCETLPSPPPGDSTEPLRWWRKGAAIGDAGSMACLGFAYLLGHNVSQDFHEALRWLRLAAEKGDASAQEHLGFCYMAGHGVKQNSVEAEKWTRMAAEQGSASAQHNLACLYHLGQGVPKDALQAFSWWLKAAQQGHVTAQNNVGYSYDVGEIIPRDYVEAYKWMSLAASQGFAGAKEHCDELAAKMTVDQRDESQRRIEEFKQCSEKPELKLKGALERLAERLAEKGDLEARTFLDNLLVQRLDERPDIQRLRAEYSKNPEDFLRNANNLARREPNYPRIPIPAEVRREVWRRDQGRCVKCNSREKLEYDHIIPVSGGGSNTARNIELLCESCNRAKAARIE
jgi:hypothetical protein